MRYKLLGKSGLRVAELCLGTMTFGEEWGWGASREESRRIFEAYVAAGGNYIDTANRYTEGTSEKFIGEFVGAARDEFVIATKYTLSMNPDDLNASGNHRKNMRRSVEASLRRLNTDYLDVLWLHAWDFLTPVEEVMRGLDDLVHAGKVLYLGISDTPAWVVAQANTMAELRGWTSFICLQIEYSLIQRGAERDLLPMARAFEMTVTPWAVVGGGILTGKYTGDPKRDAQVDHKREPSDKRLNEHNLKIAGVVKDIADAVGRPAAQVAINWVRQQPGSIIPIIGARTAEQAKSNLACLEWELDRNQLNRLAEVSAIQLGFPHEFLAEDRIKNLVYGRKWPALDFPHPAD